jgi:hypothetical protein
MATTSGPTGISAAVKYWILAALTILLAVVTYLSGHPDLTEATLIGAVLVAIPLLIQEFEGA